MESHDVASGIREALGHGRFPRRAARCRAAHQAGVSLIVYDKVRETT